MLESLTWVVQGATAVTVHQVHLHCTVVTLGRQGGTWPSGPVTGGRRGSEGSPGLAGKVSPQSGSGDRCPLALSKSSKPAVPGYN